MRSPAPAQAGRPTRHAAATPKGHFPEGASQSAFTNTLLGCGIGYSILYSIGNDVIAAHRMDGYSPKSQAVSELSAKGSPARRLLAATAPLSSALMLAFGTGVTRSANGDPSLRATGRLLAGGGIMSLAWLPFPMSSREQLAKGTGGGNDIGHMVLSAASLALILSQFGNGAKAFGKRFRTYSALSAATVIGFGALTAVESQKLPRGQPTPHLGLVERVMLGAWLLWMDVLALILMRRSRDQAL